VGRRRNCGSVSRARLIPSSKRPDGCGVQKVSYSKTAEGPLPELKRSNHEVNHSLSLIDDVLKNMCVHFPMCLHDVKRDDLVVIIIARNFVVVVVVAKSLLLNYRSCLHYICRLYLKHNMSGL